MLVRQREPGQYLLGSQGLYSVLSPFNVTDVGRPEHASIGREQRRTQPGNRRKRLRQAESISDWWQKYRVRHDIGQKSQNSEIGRASSRVRACDCESISVVAVYLKK